MSGLVRRLLRKGARFRLGWAVAFWLGARNLKMARWALSRNAAAPRSPKFFNSKLRRALILKIVGAGAALCNDGARYLVYIDDNLSPAGMGDCFSQLQKRQREASRFNRRLVVNPPRLAAHHTLNAPSKDWRRYVDLDRAEPRIDYILRADFDEMRFNAAGIAVVSRFQPISRRLNSDFRVIVRDLENVAMGRTVEIEDGEPFEPVRNKLAARVQSEADAVLRLLPRPFVALHIRRNDVLTTHPASAWATSAPSVLNELRRHNSANLPVFLMTDERQTDFYESLRADFRIYSRRDFERLATWARTTDNYSLYLAERAIAYQAERIITNQRRRDGFDVLSPSEAGFRWLLGG